jgi:hypothetical protein
MKQFNLLFLGTLSLLVLDSCASSNEVVGGMIQKRKHTDGIYWDHSDKSKTTVLVEEELEFDIYKFSEKSLEKFGSVTTIKAE